MNRRDAIRCTEESLQSLDVMQNALESEHIDFEKLIAKEGLKIPSNLDACDLAASISFGIIGTVINNSKKVSEFLQKIHNDASTPDTPNTLLGKLLRHSGDHMDKVPGERTKYPHRIMWGHDIFSIGPGNPFYLLIKQYGVGRGLLQAFRHLIADTCSRQGLPIPGHSFFDNLEKLSDGKETMGNRLINIANKINTEVGNSNSGSNVNNEAFNSLFSVHMQDVTAKGLTWGLTKAYIMARGVKDEIRITQLHLIATFVNFYGTTFWGVFKTGVPKINWILLVSLVKLTAQLYIKSNRETKALQQITTGIIESNIELERRVNATGDLFPTHINPWNYLDDYYKEQAAIEDLIDFFEEDD